MRFSFAIIALLLLIPERLHAQTTQASPSKIATYEIGIDARIFPVGVEAGSDAMNRRLKRFPESKEFIDYVASQTRISAEKVSDVVTMNEDFSQGSDQFGGPPQRPIQLTVDLTDCPQAQITAGQMLDELVAKLQQHLRDEFLAPSVRESRIAQQRMAELQDRIAQRDAEISAIQKMLRGKTGRGDVSASAINAEMNDIDTALRQLDIDVEAKRARVAALEENIAKLSKQVDEQLTVDPVIQELGKIVELKQRQLDLLKTQFNAGVIPEVEVNKATEEVAEARARLLDRKGSTASASTELLGQWTRELLTLSIDAAESTARQKALRERLAALIDAADQAQSIPRLQEEQGELLQSLKETRSNLEATKSFIDEFIGPEVIVMKKDLR